VVKLTVKVVLVHIERCNVKTTVGELS